MLIFVFLPVTTTSTSCHSICSINTGRHTIMVRGGVSGISELLVLYTSICQFFLAQCTQGTIRIQGGTANQGRVEICNNDVWGTVCDDVWGTADAQVACRQLGFSATGWTSACFHLIQCCHRIVCMCVR